MTDGWHKFEGPDVKCLLPSAQCICVGLLDSMMGWEMEGEIQGDLEVFDLQPIAYFCISVPQAKKSEGIQLMRISHTVCYGNLYQYLLRPSYKNKAWIHNLPSRNSAFHQSIFHALLAPLSLGSIIFYYLWYQMENLDFQILKSKKKNSTGEENL